MKSQTRCQQVYGTVNDTVSGQLQTTSQHILYMYNVSVTDVHAKSLMALQHLKLMALWWYGNVHIIMGEPKNLDQL